MAPKTKAKAKAGKSPKATSTKEHGAHGYAHDTKEQAFCRQITAPCGEDKIKELVSYILFGAGLLGNEGEVDDAQIDILLLSLGLSAVQRLCQIEGPSEPCFHFLKNQGLETLTHLARGNCPQQCHRDAEMALAAVYDRLAAWIDDVDHLEFMQLPQVVKLGKEYAPHDVNVALSFLSCLERFATHRTENAIAILEKYHVLKIAHVLLAAHRAPDFVDEVFLALFRICDFPGNHVAQPLAAELDLIETVIEALTQAPLNMRLQFDGFRLLCLWNQPEVFPEGLQFYEKEIITAQKDKVRGRMRQAGVFTVLDNAFDVLARGGLTHQASWVRIIGANSLMPDRLAKRVGEIPRDEHD